MSRLRTLLDYYSKKNKKHIVFIIILSLAIVGFIDYLTGVEISFSIFYLIPVIIATWFLKKTWGIVTSIVAASIWIFADIQAGSVYTNFLVPAWNSLVRLGFFLLITFLLHELKIELEQEREVARVDYLTKILNRLAFTSLLEKERKRAIRYKHCITVAYIDLDNFKAVNDSFGHETGDALLCGVAETLRDSIRSTDIAGRIGGDEFAVVFPELSKNEATATLEKLQKIMDKKMKDNNWPVTFSIGVAVFNKIPEDVYEMLSKADAIMYTVKKREKNTFLCEEIN